LDERLVEWVAKALKRKPSTEARPAGALRVAAAHSPRVRRSLLEATDVLVSRRSFGRPLYRAAVRALADANERRLPHLLVTALAGDDAGGLATLAAAARFRTAKLDRALARQVASPHPQIAFAAALARPKRDARHLMAAAARLRESARIDLCTQLLVPLTMGDDETLQLPAAAAPAMSALRDSERHLGRWLVFAHAGMACGDTTPLHEATRRATRGSVSTKTAWSLLAWALAPGRDVPEVRPTVDVVARLSDRPTSERDMSFLFRMASVGATQARALLESLSKPPLRAGAGVRAASALAHRYDRAHALSGVRALVHAKRRDLEGLAVAALWDAGEHAEARQRAAGLCDVRNLSAMVWGGLVVRSERSLRPIISETAFRRLHHGCVR